MTDSSLPARSPSVPDCAPSPQALARQIRRMATLPQVPWLHQEVARRLAQKLEPIRLEPQHWIDWSAFMGGGAEFVQARYPQAQRWVVEPVPELAQRSAQEAQQAARRHWRTLFRREVTPVFVESSASPLPALPQGAHMLWANMTLHAAASLPAMLMQWHRHLAVDGFLMCSGLGPDTARELREAYRQRDWALPTIDFVDMHDLGDELVKAGFADPVMDMETITLTWGSAQAMLDEIRTWGGNVAQGRFTGLRTPRWRQRLLDHLTDALMRPDGRLGLTVEVVYGHAVKPVPRVKVEAESRVSLQDMRTMIRRDHPQA